MTMQELAVLVLKLSVLAIVFSLGLKATPRDVIHLLGRPGLLLRSILAMNVVMVVFAVLVCLVFPMALPVKIALVSLALSPVPPILPNSQTKAGGSVAYSISLLVIASLVSLVLIPLALALCGPIFGKQYNVSMGKLIFIIVLSIIGPLCLGLLLRAVLPKVAERIAKPFGMLAFVLMVLSALPIAYGTGIVLWQLVGNGVVIFLLLFSIFGLAVGHFLGGPDEGDRSVLALATATRHPAIALSIATINFPEEKAVLAVLLWHLVFAIIVTMPYVRWHKRALQAIAGGVNVEKR